MQLSLYVRSGPTSGQIFPLPDAGVTLIGRNSSNHIALLDRRVSANHCVLRPKTSGGAFVLMDARSRHGTTVNDRRVDKALVGLGDILTMGPFALEVIETPPRQYDVPPARPAADRPARFEIAPRGWRKKGRPLPPGSATVMGRGPFCQIQVDDTFASACHCILCLDPTDDGRMPFVIDLYSSNGTHINRRPIHRKHLLPGDVLVIGDHPFRLRRLEGVEMAPPEPEVEIPPAPPRERIVTTTVMPPGEPAEPAARQTPQPVTFAPEPAEAEPVEPEAAPAPEPEPVLPQPPPEPTVPVAPEAEPSVADVLTPVEPAAGEETEEALTDEDLEPLEAAEPAAEEPAREPTPGPAREPAPPAPEPEPAAAAPPPEPIVPPPEQEAPSAAPTAEFVRRDSETKLVRGRPAAAAPVNEDRSGTDAFGDTESVQVLTLPEPAVHARAPDRLLAEAPDDYDEFFGFERPPFLLRPDPDCFFDTQHHWDVLDTLVRWLKTGPPVAVLFAEPGCGKSLLVECLARRLAYRRPAPVVVRTPLEDTAVPGLVDLALARAAEHYADLAAEGDDPLARWRGAMKALYPRRGLVAFLLDDADALPEDRLRALGELFESEPARAVARLLLAGGDDLRDLVAEPPLAYHLGTACYLAPLDPDEVAPYLAHRIFHASGRRELPFTERAAGLIGEYAGGVPALINVVADAALLQAFHEGRRQVGRETVEQAIREAFGSPQNPS